eukprot:3940299-Rhodomonas_salina.7
MGALRAQTGGRPALVPAVSPRSVRAASVAVSALSAPPNALSVPRFSSPARRLIPDASGTAEGRRGPWFKKLERPDARKQHAQQREATRWRTRMRSHCEIKHEKSKFLEQFALGWKHVSSHCRRLTSCWSGAFCVPVARSSPCSRRTSLAFPAQPDP